MVTISDAILVALRHHLVRGQAKDATACCQEALRLQRDYAKAHNNLGGLTAQRKVQDALASYQAALCLQPSYIEPHINQGVCLAE